MAILGIGAGKIDLSLNSLSYRPNDTITGTAILTVNEDIKARGVFARFWAEKEEGSGKHRHTRILHEQAVQLDSERAYGRMDSGKSYNFNFRVPEGILMPLAQGGGIINGIMNYARNASNNSIRWKVQAKLDLPMAFDVSSTKKITVTL